MNHSEPPVSIVTPVFNGEPYLAECIESVLAQTYRNWEYLIVDNCSQDRTLAIARRFAAADSRVRVVAADKFVGGIENHHRAFSLISPSSRYCKVVSADDWLMPTCLARMIEVAEAHPTVGIVGAYQRCGNAINWKGIPEGTEFLTGRDAARLTLIDNVSIFGNPTSNLFRAELVRGPKPFFPHTRPHADTSAAFDHLRQWDFGFVHEVLSAERVHEGQISSRVRDLNMMELAILEIILEYGRFYMTADEFQDLKERAFDRYYRNLGGCLLKLKGREFWRFHATGLKGLGYQLSWKKVAAKALVEAGAEMRHPGEAYQKFVNAVKSVVVRAA